MIRRNVRRGLDDFQRLLARSIFADDPARAVAALARNRRLPADLRRLAAKADADGVQLSALLVKKLRFERLMRGDASLTQSFEHAPSSFVQAFRDYESENPPRSFFPAAEAAAFGKWLLARDGVSRRRRR